MNRKPNPIRMTPTIALPGLVNPHDLTADRQFSMNLARGMEVLRAFTATDPMLGNREISDRTGLPKPTVSRLTYTLTLLGYLTRDVGLQKYRLGTGVLSLGHPLLASMHVRQAARPLMEQLARKTGCTVNLGMRDRSNVVYIETVRTDTGNVFLPDIGSTRPLLAAAIGRALILACAPAERKAILNHLKVQDRALFEQHRAAWEADQKRFEAHGFCHARRRLAEGRARGRGAGPARAARSAGRDELHARGVPDAEGQARARGRPAPARRGPPARSHPGPALSGPHRKPTR